jgi:hypothetical protein
MQLVNQVLRQRVRYQWAEEWLEKTLRVLGTHRIDFENIEQRLPSPINIRVQYADIVTKLFADGRVNWARIVTVLAFATYLQERFTIDLEEETSELLEPHLLGWLQRRKYDDDECYDFPDNIICRDWLRCSVNILLHNVVTELLM